MYSFHTAECFPDFLLKYEVGSQCFPDVFQLKCFQCFPMFFNVFRIKRFSCWFSAEVCGTEAPTQPPAQRSSVCLLLQLPRSLLRNPQTHQVPLYTLLCFVSFMNITTIDINITMISTSVELSNVIMEIFWDIINVCLAVHSYGLSSSLHHPHHSPNPN